MHPTPRSLTRPLTRPLGLAGLAALVLALAACGGNNQTEYKSFKLSTSTLATPSENGTVDFRAEWSVASEDFSNYTIKAHIVPATDTDPSLTDNNRFLLRVCGAPLGLCSDPETESCTYRRGSDRSERTIACTNGSSVTLAPGNYKVVAKECHLDSTLDEKCSSKDFAVELQ